MKKLILHIPHASTNIPYLDGFQIDKQEIEHELLILTDWHTDDLYEDSESISVVADFSRIFCDPERFADDKQEPMADLGMGVLYTQTESGKEMRIVSDELRSRILTEFYFKHHKKLTEAVKGQLQESGTALILDCHSFPDTPLRRNSDQSVPRPDFNIGTDAFHTRKDLVQAAMGFFAERNLTCVLNAPFSGSIVPMEYYQKNRNVQSIMLEVNRRLYLKPGSSEHSVDYEQTKNVVHEFIQLMKEQM